MFDVIYKYVGVNVKVTENVHMEITSKLESCSPNFLFDLIDVIFILFLFWNGLL